MVATAPVGDIAPASPREAPGARGCGKQAPWPWTGKCHANQEGQPQPPGGGGASAGPLALAARSARIKAEGKFRLRGRAPGYGTATTACQMALLSDGLWHPPFHFASLCGQNAKSTAKPSQLRHGPGWSSLTSSLNGRLLNRNWVRPQTAPSLQRPLLACAGDVATFNTDIRQIRSEAGYWQGELRM